MSKHLKKCLTIVRKIQFGISGSHRTEPNNTEQKLQYSVNSVRSTTATAVDRYTDIYWHQLIYRLSADVSDRLLSNLLVLAN